MVKGMQKINPMKEAEKREKKENEKAEKQARLRRGTLEEEEASGVRRKSKKMSSQDKCSYAVGGVFAFIFFILLCLCIPYDSGEPSPASVLKNGSAGEAPNKTGPASTQQ
eukprot:TRINITY_DN9685_c0_g1_i1.p1 TRINITY_DN9685_c0_g1~~TRINITY_DN9685_c0_g1_i1.p1  ORF type:complete len:110 (+),score=18.90 TRINITY_DN9685_c0_g1_i1:80-409(+)